MQPFQGLLIVSGLVALSGCSADILSCHVDLDTRAARLRTTHYAMFLPVVAETRDTVLTPALLPHPEGGIPNPEWHKVSTFYWYLPYSPYWRYHKALYALQALQRATERIEFTPAAMQFVAQRATELWQNDDRGSGFLLRVASVADDAATNGCTSIDASDLRARFGGEWAVRTATDDDMQLAR